MQFLLFLGLMIVVVLVLGVLDVLVGVVVFYLLMHLCVFCVLLKYSGFCLFDTCTSRASLKGVKLTTFVNGMS